ncbi:hypothetical protein EMIT0P294_11216 [Pseudomonas sp. IT-P294]
MSELSALIGEANRQAQFIKWVYLRCVAGAGFYGWGVSQAALYTLRYIANTNLLWERACPR